jgi:hypothetical protein
MAIDTWVTCTVDPGAGNKPDGFDHVHVWKRNTATAGDVAIAFDKSKVKTRTALRAAVLQGLRVLEGGAELTP